MERINEVRIKYLVYFNSNFWVETDLEVALKDKESLKKFSGVAISEFIEYIENGNVVKHEERRLQ